MEMKDKALKKSSISGKRKAEGEVGALDGSRRLLQGCKRTRMGGEHECSPPKKHKSHMQSRLPVDILIEILSRIPGSDLIRLRCTCKLFYNLTRDCSFISLHLERSRRANIPPRVLTFSYPCSDLVEANMNLTLLDNWVPKHNFQLPRIKGRSYRITDSCNGIVCIYDSDGGVQLLNPTTREHLVLPEPTNVAGSSYLPSLRHCEVLTVGADSWRQICTIDYEPYEDGISINGTMFWIVVRKETIVAINLEDEKFMEIPPPSSDFMVGGLTFIGELEGSACFSFSRWDYPYLVDIWILKDLANHVWVHRYCIDVTKSIKFYSFNDWWASPMFIYREKLLLNWGNMLCYHHLQSKEESFEIMYHTEHTYMARVHVESLISLRDL